MGRTLLTNNSPGVITLPPPFLGMLGPGDSCILQGSPAVVSAILSLGPLAARYVTLLEIFDDSAATPGFTAPVKTVDADYTIQHTDRTVQGNPADNTTVVLTLPPLADQPGEFFLVVNIAENGTLTLNAGVGDTINGQPFVNVGGPFTGYYLENVGDDWRITANAYGSN